MIPTHDITKTPINFPHSELDLVDCKAIFGGVAWPTKRPGFAVIIAMTNKMRFDNCEIYLLAESETFDTRELIRWCGASDRQYRPVMWIGDDRNAAADELMREMASELTVPSVDGIEPPRCFSVSSSLILEMDYVYAYCLPHIKMLLDPERRSLFLKDSRVVAYLGEIEDEDVAEMKLGEYPAIEALSFAVVEMRRMYQKRKNTAYRREKPPSAMA